MKKVFLIGLICLSLIPHAFAETQLVDRIVAVVNDDPITQSELDAYLRPLFDQLRQNYSGTKLRKALSDAQAKILNQLIEDRLVYDEAKKREIQIPPEQIQSELDSFKNQFKDPQDFDHALMEEGMNLGVLKERLEKKMMVQALHEMEVRSKVVVSPNEIEDYYAQHPEEFSSKKQIRIRSLTIKKSAEARRKGLMDEESRSRIEKLKRQISNGEDFSELALQYSEDYQAANGGLSDWIKPGSMIPEIEKVIFSLKPGEVSDIIETPMGFHLFRVEGKKESSHKTLEEVRDAIYNKIFRQKAKARFDAWMEDLKRDAYISIH